MIQYQTNVTELQVKTLLKTLIQPTKSVTDEIFSIYPVETRKAIPVYSTSSTLKPSTKKPVLNKLRTSKLANGIFNFSIKPLPIYKWNQHQEMIFSNVYKSSIVRKLVSSNASERSVILERSVTSERSATAENIGTENATMKMMLMFLMGIIFAIPLILVLVFTTLRLKQRYGKPKRNSRAIRREIRNLRPISPPLTLNNLHLDVTDQQYWERLYNLQLVGPNTEP